MTNAPLPGGDATPLDHPVSRADLSVGGKHDARPEASNEGWAIAVHESVGYGTAMSGVRSEDGALGRARNIPADKDLSLVQNLEAQLTLARQQAEKLQQDNDKWRSLLKTTGGAIPLDLPSILRRAESAEAQVTALHQERDTLQQALYIANHADHPRIVDRCPSCGHDSLFIGTGGYLTCSWLECRNPCLGRSIAELKARAEAAEQQLRESQ